MQIYFKNLNKISIRTGTNFLAFFLILFEKISLLDPLGLLVLLARWELGFDMRKHKQVHILGIFFMMQFSVDTFFKN